MMLMSDDGLPLRGMAIFFLSNYVIKSSTMNIKTNAILHLCHDFARGFLAFSVNEQYLIRMVAFFVRIIAIIQLNSERRAHFEVNTGKRIME